MPCDESFTSEAELRIAWGTLLGVANATLSVLRDGQTLQIEVDAKDLMDATLAATSNLPAASRRTVPIGQLPRRRSG